MAGTLKTLVSQHVRRISRLQNYCTEGRLFAQAGLCFCSQRMSRENKLCIIPENAYSQAY